MFRNARITYRTSRHGGETVTDTFRVRYMPDLWRNQIDAFYLALYAAVHGAGERDFKIIASSFEGTNDFKIIPRPIDRSTAD